jgi:hypothetical protein
VRRVLLSPKWLLGHALALAAAAACVRLGWWQWERAQSSGSLQNLGYAVQWPVFGLFIAAFWGRVIRDGLRPPADRPQRRPQRGVPAGGVPAGGPPANGLASAPPAQPSRPPLAADDPEDAEVIAYNRYLAWLHEQDSRRAH